MEVQKSGETASRKANDPEEHGMGDADYFPPFTKEKEDKPHASIAGKAEEARRAAFEVNRAVAEATRAVGHPSVPGEEAENAKEPMAYRRHGSTTLD